MLHDAFRPIARDGAALVEVQLRLHKALDALSRIAPAAFEQAAAELSAYALERATAAGVSESERSALEDVAVGSGGVGNPDGNSV